MFEIEGKVWVKDFAKWKELEQKIKQNAQFLHTEIKEDFYFAWPDSNQALFRLRKLNETIFEVTQKNKKIINGIEETEEESFLISDSSAFLNLCQKIGLKILLTKKKKSLVYTQNNLTLEMNTIEKLGNFLEIEKIIQEEREKTKARQEVLQIFQVYGFTTKDLESKPYFQLLQEI